ncbi:uncharacterized mitochondrial protein AtMg00810-like [Lactuca sativa]|uniref:uncharacterized mitochondrial protein AtMg00810-like n=1 Tax=Lactuca sativa TaxID=4236 RepID=UPI000CD90192|nr:uncharacterized mitochondrial protein AtMg00810-like [Lactuca sativa]
MAVGTRLTPSLDKPAIDLTLYKNKIGSLLYLTISIESKRTTFNSGEEYFGYLNGSISLGLWYPSKSGFFIQAFSDADLGGCNLDRKRTSGGYQLLDGKLVSWKSKKQTCVSISIAEAKYVVVVACTFTNHMD